MKITKYNISNPLEIVLPQTKRKWMDDTPNGFAYRCLPMTVANGFGWDVLNKYKFSVIWNGGNAVNDISINYYGHSNPNVLAHFGSGILTFNLGFMIRTEENHNLFVRGPSNTTKRGITALDGIVETDWLPFTFTMNWKLTESNYEIVFDEGEPICNFFPIPRGYLESWDTDIKNIAENQEENKLYSEWSESRRKYNSNLKVNGNKGERDYLKGKYKDGSKFDNHQNIIRGNPFTRKEDIVIIDHRPCYDNCCLEKE